MCDYLLFVSHDGKGIIGINLGYIKRGLSDFFFHSFELGSIEKKVDKKRSSEDHTKGFFFLLFRKDKKREEIRDL